MDIPLIISAAKNALDLIRLGIEVRDDAKVAAAVLELQAKLIDLSTAGFHASEKLHVLDATIRSLEAEKRELEHKLKERESYELHALAPGRFCYRYKPEPGSMAPEHYLCQLCYDKGIKSVLRLNEKAEWHSRHYACAEVDKGTHDLFF